MKEPCVMKIREKIRHMSQEEAKRELAHLREGSHLDRHGSHSEEERRGLQLGLERGLEKGLRQGIEKGAHDAYHKVCMALLHDQEFAALEAPQIAERTHIPLAIIEEALLKLHEPMLSGALGKH